MYFLFAGWEYYPAGGMGDCVGIFPTREQAEQVLHWLNHYDAVGGFDWYGIESYESMLETHGVPE